MDTQSPRRTSQNTDRITIAPGDTVDRAEFAEFLRTTREQRRITLDQIADETKIASRHLAALERGDVRTWPHGMYRRAMMRAYAESIGLDKDVALEQFSRAFEQAPPKQEAVPPAHEPSLPTVTRSAVTLPNATLPKVTLPKLALPKLALPKLALPKLALPKLALPKLALPKLALPTLALPTLALPRVKAPTITLPRMRVPRLAWTSTTQRAVATIVGAALCLVIARLVFPTASAPDNAERVIASSVPPAATAPAAGTQAASAQAPQEIAAPPAAAVSEGQLVVTSEPAGARVTVNDVGWGPTPITIRYLPLGQKRVRLTMQGYVSEERTVQLGPERPNVRVQLTLRAREQASPDRH